MHEINDNIHIRSRSCGFKDYGLRQFLHNELAVEQSGDINDVFHAVYDILLALKFQLQYAGFRFFASLVVRYIIKSDYNEAAAIHDIAMISGSDERYVTTCINSSIARNKDFAPIARIALDSKTDIKIATISDAVTIVGALYKIYFNYTTDAENTEEQIQPIAYIERMYLDHGKNRTGN